MELSDKIQKLRKEHNLTQEQFAKKLFVSRTAVSKWETGRGTPSIESLQAITKIFNITLDELLSASDIITVAKNQNKESISRFSYLVDGILNILSIFGLFLPLYKTQINGIFYSIPLYQFTGLLSALYWTFPIIMTLCGIIQIIICEKEWGTLYNIVFWIGLVANICQMLLLILGVQPYPAVLFFIIFIAKGVIILKKQK